MAPAMTNHRRRGTDAPTAAGDPRGIVGYVPGGFDMFHVGHLNILRVARRHCDVLRVGVATDESLVAMKGRGPVVPLEERLEIVAAIGIVDEAVPDLSQDKRIAWARAPFDIIIKGNDWEGTAKGERLEEEMAQVGARVLYAPYTLRTSSTMLRDAITQGVVA